MSHLEEGLIEIREAKFISVLNWLANRWFGWYMETVEPQPVHPRNRLLLAVPAHIADAAEAGFQEFVKSGPILHPEELAREVMNNSYPLIHYVALAGADLLFQNTGTLIEILSVERCVGLLCLTMTCHTHTRIDKVQHTDQRPWRRHIVAGLESESAQALRDLLLPQLQNQVQHVSGLDEFCSNQLFEKLRGKLLLKMLTVVSAQTPSFITIRRAAAKESDPAEILKVVEARVDKLETAKSDERWPWLLLAWRLRPEAHKQEFLNAIGEDDTRVAGLMRDLGSADDAFDGGEYLPLNVHQRGVIVGIVGARFPPSPMPEGVWSPPTNYDRSRFVQRHISVIGDSAGREAEHVILSLLDDPQIAAYGDYLRHALATWRRNERLRTAASLPFDRLIRSLAGGPPANAAELRAFTVAHLDELQIRLRRESDNAWRDFWNVDGHGRPENGRPENVCRDVIVRTLTARFERAGLSQETEARFVGDTRCDIRVDGINAIVPVEVKCDWNPELWTAWKAQLDEQYAADPRAQGFGVYLVIWFGSSRGRGTRVIRSPGNERATSAAECKSILAALMAEYADRLALVVLDISPV